MELLLWNIYHIDNCIQAIPPKDKYVILVSKNPKVLGFFINSDINAFKERNPNRKVLQIPIQMTEPSWVDCSYLTEFRKIDFYNCRREVGDELKVKIRQAVQDSVFIEERDKKDILGDLYIPRKLKSKP